jgi:surfactin synthase thioesterase subunit
MRTDNVVRREDGVNDGEQRRSFHGGHYVTGRWFLTQVPRPRAAIRLYCLPHAGGAAATYAAWPPALGIDVEVNAVTLPGRERRMGEPAVIDPVAIAEAISGHADRPFAVYGHSMGARLGFEVVRELRRGGGGLPCQLFVGACQAPDLPRGNGRYDGLSTLGDAELIQELALGGGIPDEVLAVPELVELLTPVFRADFGWLDAYEYAGEPPLPVPITAFAGEDDQAAPRDLVAGWSRQTSAGFELHVLSGGHFFHHDQLPALSALIRAGLRAPQGNLAPG